MGASTWRIIPPPICVRCHCVLFVLCFSASAVMKIGRLQRNMDDIMTLRAHVVRARASASSNQFSSAIVTSFLLTHAKGTFTTPLYRTHSCDYTPEIQFAVIINEHGTHAPPNDLEIKLQLSHTRFEPWLTSNSPRLLHGRHDEYRRMFHTISKALNGLAGLLLHVNDMPPIIRRP